MSLGQQAMRDSRVEFDAATGDDIEYTQSLKRLSEAGLSAAGSDDVPENSLTVLLLCRDTNAQKWGPRWLKQAGLNVMVSPDTSRALDLALSTGPDVIVVEAGLKDSRKLPLYNTLLQVLSSAIPVIVLCASTREYNAASKSDAFDVVRKPLEWPLVAARTQHAAELARSRLQITKLQSSLDEALEIANQARQRLRSRENFEPVTGLPNRRKFVDLLQRAMQAAARDSNMLAVFVIGFSRFRLVVEALGQEQADLVLAEIGEKLSDCLRDACSAQVLTSGLRTAAAASVDSSRFALMLTCSKDNDELRPLQQKLNEKLSHPVQISGQTIYLSACIGIAVYPQDSEEPESLLAGADNAMRDAQSRGGGFKFYSAAADAAAARRLRLEHLLHEAVDNGELRVAYQPIALTTTSRIVSAEALLRWMRPDGSVVKPDEFVPIAEESGLMIRIGEFVLARACQQLNAWRSSGCPVEKLCVNVSRVQLMSGDFVATVKRVLEKNNIKASQLELELSERGVFSGNPNVMKQLEKLKKLGVRLSLDDFGTGDSAIAYLKEMPIDVLKIDRSYTSGLTVNSKEAAMTSAMVALAQRLGLRVIAEGVETEAQRQALVDLGCEEYQGFLISEAVEGDEFPLLLDVTPAQK